MRPPGCAPISGSPARPAYRRGDTRPNADPGAAPSSSSGTCTCSPRRNRNRPFAERLDLALAESSGRQIRVPRLTARGPVPVSSASACETTVLLLQGSPLQTSRSNGSCNDPPRYGALSLRRLATNGRRRCILLQAQVSRPAARSDHEVIAEHAPYHLTQREMALLSSISAANASTACGGTCCAPGVKTKQLRARAVRINSRLIKARLSARWDPRFRVSGGRRDAALDQGPTTRAPGGAVCQAWITAQTADLSSASLRASGDQPELGRATLLLRPTPQTQQAGRGNHRYICLRVRGRTAKT